MFKNKNIVVGRSQAHLLKKEPTANLVSLSTLSVVVSVYRNRSSVSSLLLLLKVVGEGPVWGILSDDKDTELAV